MSHVTKIDLEIKDLDALEEACEALGLELERDKKNYAWWGTSVGDYPIPEGMRAEDLGKCDHAIKVKGTNPHNGSSGPWEIGVVKSGDSHRLVFDFYGSAGRQITDKAGIGLNRLRHEYAVATAKKAAVASLQRKGWVIAPREDLGNGRTRLRLRKQ